MDIVMAGHAGRSGACILARANRDMLRGMLAHDIVTRAEEEAPDYTLPDDVAARAYACVRMKGSVLRALRILGEMLQCGMDIDIRRIPILQEDIEILEVLDSDPYRISSAGGWLIACTETPNIMAPDVMVTDMMTSNIMTSLKAASIPASVIGRTTAVKARVLRLGDCVQHLEVC